MKISDQVLQRFGTILVALGGLICPVAAQTPTLADFPEVYKHAEKKLYEKYTFNRRVVFVTRENSLGEKPGHKSTPVEMVVVSGADASRVNFPNDESLAKNAVTGELLLQNERYDLQRGEKQGTFKIGSHRTQKMPGRPYGFAFTASNPNMYPMMYMSSVSQGTMGSVIAYAQMDLPQGPHYKLLDVHPATWRGMSAVEVSVEDAFKVVNKVYLDPNNDLAFLGFESGGSFDTATRKTVGKTISGRVTYRPSGEGFPLPAKFEVWETEPGGQPVRKGFAEVTSYEKYAPKPGDFDLEAQFGVKPLPIPAGGSASASAGGRSWRGLYVAAGLLAVFTAALVVIARRKRRASRSNP